MRRFLPAILAGLVVAVGLTAAPDSFKEQAIKQDRAKYDGTWRVIALEVNGEKVAESDARKIVVLNHGDTWIIQVEGKEVSKGTSTIDPTRMPRTIDFIPAEMGSKATTYHGIYEITGDTRKLCFAQPGKPRPTAFVSKPGSEDTLVIFQREKK